MKKLSFVMFLLAICLIPAHLLAGGIIKGRITDVDTGDPLMGANVLITSENLSLPTGSSTDDDGLYRVENLPSGFYLIKVSYIGYNETSQTVHLGEDAVEIVDLELSSAAIKFQTYVVTASRRKERIEDAPAAISVITERNIRRESNTNLGDYMKAIKGVDFTQSGVDSYNLSARGFNSSFSSRLLTLTDGRMANVPSLRLIAYNVIPVTSDDVQQIEVVLGPSSATYGPNAHSGVLNIITKPPRYSDPLVLNFQTGDQNLRKVSARAAKSWKYWGFKVSGAYLEADEWRHFNEDEWEGHHYALIGNWDLTRDGLDAVWQPNLLEEGNPTIAVPIIDPWPNDSRELTAEYLDSMDINWYEENGVFYAYVSQADGLDNDGNSDDYVDLNGNGEPDAGEPGVNNDGIVYADGIDNNGNGYIDEDIDTGIDDLNEKWYDGIDNDGDGQIDESDEKGTKFLNRSGQYGINRFGEYIFDDDGNMLFDSNQDGCFGCEGDSTVVSYRVNDSNGDGIDDFLDFKVRNVRADVRIDYDPSEDFKMSIASGYAWAKNINITGIARYLADGWVYRYGQLRMTYKNWFAQTYMNSSDAGNTRSMATGGRIKDTSRKFSAQIQHHKTFWGERQRIVWGIDYFRTMPQTFGTILHDNNLWDRIDNDGDGEDGSPTEWTETIDNEYYDPGEGFKPTSYDSLDGIDNAQGAIADGIDNDGDGLIDEGIDEKDEDNRNFTNEFGFYIQSNTKLTDKIELIFANRVDAHEQLTNLIDFDSKGHSPNPLKWTFDINQTSGLQISPKVGLMYRPSDNQNFRLTWAKAFNTPSSQALFLDIFVQRFSVFKVYAKGAGDGYHYPRDENGFLTFWDISGDVQEYWFYNNISMEQWDDLDGNGEWSFEDGSADTVYDFWGNVVESYDFDDNGSFDYHDYGTDGIEGEPYTDTNGNGSWDFGEPWEDLDGNFQCTGCDLNGTEGNGYFDEGEPAEGHELWTDANSNGLWDGMYKLLFPSADPRIQGSFQDDIPIDPKPIKPEIVQTLEFGYKGRLNPRLYGTLDVFYSKYNSFVSPILFLTPLVVANDPNLTIEKFFDAPTDYIKGVVAVGDTNQYVGNPPVVVGYLNYGKVYMWGADMSMTYFFSRNLILDANYSFLSISNFSNPLTGTKEPINAPRNKWSLKATYESPKGFSVAAYMRHVDQFPWKSGIYYGTIKDYNIFDLHLGYKISDHFKLRASINNVLDNRHTEIVGGPELGRMIVLRLTGQL